MRNLFFALLAAALLTVVGCDNRTTIDKPIVANNFHDLLTKIDSICSNVSKTNCEHLWALVKLSLPEATSSKYQVKQDEAVIAETLYTRLNQKTPRELLLIYKSDMLEQVQADIEKDKTISASLDDINATFKRTEKYIKSFQIKDIKNTFSASSVKVMLSIFNYSKFNIKQISGKVKYLDQNDAVVAVSQDFSYKFSPTLMSNERLTLLIYVDMKAEDIKNIKATKEFKTVIEIRSMMTDSKGEPTLIFELPASYDLLKQKLLESEELQRKRVSLINSISTE